MKQLILLRGIAGCGKSTQASRLVVDHFEQGGQSAVICSTDSFHIKDGQYVFQPEKLNMFHSSNQSLVGRYISLGTELIIVDNTNIKRKDMDPYIKTAQRYHYEVKELIVGEKHLYGNSLESYIDLCAERNTHGVPRETIAKMAMKFEL